jgi:hypothetical protein
VLHLELGVGEVEVDEVLECLGRVRIEGPKVLPDRVLELAQERGVLALVGLVEKQVVASMTSSTGGLRSQLPARQTPMRLPSSADASSAAR